MTSELAAALRRAPMFRGRTNTVATALATVLGVWAAIPVVRWMFVRAVWSLPEGGSAAACRTAGETGACWAVIDERLRFILFGAFPVNEQWRPALASAVFIGLYAVSARRRVARTAVAFAWTAGIAVSFGLLRGGVAGLTNVPSDQWGGLPVTLLLATVGCAAATPLAVLLAVGRRSHLPLIRTLSAVYVESVRGVPVVTWLFVAAVMFPLFVPQGLAVDRLIRAQVAFVLVIAAHLAEVIRGGLQAVPQGQSDAAASLGLSWWSAQRQVVLPQAFRLTIPSLVNTYIAFFKDTSLVAVIGLFDLLGTAKAVVVDPKWFGFGVEVYLFAAAVYFVFGAALSEYSRRLERRLAAAQF